jgi:hypothetical protein
VNPIRLDVIVGHELGHAVCADELGLSVLRILLPTLITKADDSAYYAYKAQTEIGNMYRDDAPKVRTNLNPAILVELAGVSVAGVVGEMLLQSEPVSSDAVLANLRTSANWSDFEMLSGALGVESANLDDARPHVERAERALTGKLDRIRAAVRAIVDVVVDRAPHSIKWAEIEVCLETANG